MFKKFLIEKLLTYIPLLVSWIFLFGFIYTSNQNLQFLGYINHNQLIKSNDVIINVPYFSRVSDPIIIQINDKLHYEPLFIHYQESSPFTYDFISEEFCISESLVEYPGDLNNISITNQLNGDRLEFQTACTLNFKLPSSNGYFSSVFFIDSVFDYKFSNYEHYYFTDDIENNSYLDILDLESLRISIQINLGIQMLIFMSPYLIINLAWIIFILRRKEFIKSSLFPLINNELKLNIFIIKNFLIYIFFISSSVIFLSFIFYNFVGLTFLFIEVPFNLLLTLGFIHK